MTDAPREDGASGAAGWLGRTLDERYRIDRLLGEGGMGAVFVAHHLRLDKPVALKVILPEHAGNELLATRFAREAMLTAKIDHPHVVSAMDTGSLPGGGAYLVMQLAKGRSLRAFVRSETGWPLACELGAQIADALAAAHAVGIVHRDLKPENVIVEERDGVVHSRVLDFGIARGSEPAPSESPQRPLTRAGAVLGTPGYMPPEQALGEKVDERADLYALGVCVWELAAGRALFDHADSRGIALAQLTEPVPALPGDDVPTALVELLDALLEPKREARPASAIEVRDRLRAIGGLASRLSGVPRASGPSAVPLAPTPVAMVSAPTPMAPASAASTSVPAAAPRSSATSRRAAWIALAIAGAMAVVLFAVGAVLFGGGELSDVPRAQRADVDTMLHDPSMLARFEAAGRLAPVRDTLPPFAAHVCDFERAQSCEERRAAARALQADADPRAVPTLARAVALPTTGCGPHQTSDCHACMRDDLTRALRASSGVQDGTAGSAPPSSAAPESHEEHHPTKGHPSPHHGHGH